MDLELDALGPGLGRGCIATASRVDGFDAVTIRVFVENPLPIGLIAKFIEEAQTRLAVDGS